MKKVFVSGCYDLLHSGHVEFFRQASQYGDLIMTAGKEVEMPIARIAQLARAVGIHMIIATQRPTTSIITGNIKANFPGRIAFKVSSMMDSRIILDRPGANQLIGMGDMLYLNGNEPTRVQCAFISTKEIGEINEFIEHQSGPTHPMELPEPKTMLPHLQETFCEIFCFPTFYSGFKGFLNGLRQFGCYKQ
jgi:hypothetical protein